MNIDDPKWTAYALDELPAEERRELEAALRDMPEVAAELVEMRALAARLRSELKVENSSGLTADQRASVLAAATAGDLGKPLNGAVRSGIEPRTATDSHGQPRAEHEAAGEF